MHRDFAEWYQEVALEPNAQELAARDKAVSALAKIDEPDEIVELVRLASGRPVARRDAADAIESAAHRADPTYRRGGAKELGVLAGAALVRMLGGKVGAEQANAVALLLLAAECPGLRAAAAPRAFAAEARSHVGTASAALRADWPRPSIASVATKLSTAEQLSTVGLPALSADVANVHGALDGLQKSVAAWAGSVERRLRLQQEEIDAAWWVFGGYSRLADSPVAALPSAAAPLVLGRELAGLVTTLPGPASAPGLIDRMLGQVKEPAKEVTLEQALAALPATCRGAWGDETDSDGAEGDVTPVTSAIRHAGSGAEGQEWAGWVRRKLGLDPSAPVSPYRLAEQVYLERLALHALAGLGS